MGEKLKEKLGSLLNRVLNVVVAEEGGSAEHITEKVSSEEIEELMGELDIEVESDMNDLEIEEAVDDYIFDNELSSINELDEDDARDWICSNTTGTNKFIEKLKEKLNNK